MDEIIILKFAIQYIHGTVQQTCFDVTCKISLTVSIINIGYDWLLIGLRPGYYPVTVDSNNNYYQTTNQSTLLKLLKSNMTC